MMIAPTPNMPPSQTGIRIVSPGADAGANQGGERENGAEDETPERVERCEYFGQGPDANLTNDHAGSFVRGVGGVTWATR